MMNFIISAATDIGLVKETNQDCISLKVINTKQGRMVFAVLCDGMGGLEEGEVASAKLTRAFEQWVTEKLPELCESTIEDYVIREQWENIVSDQNEAIKAYGGKRGINLGTTVVAMLLTQTRYYIMNVGDSRAYEIKDQISQLTVDQTFVAREVALGNMTEEEAQTDSRRNILLQCVGASENVYPDFFFGETLCDAVYMLCCDGFRHEITPGEMFAAFHPSVLLSDADMNRVSNQLIELNKQRMERDNITVALIRTF